MEVKLPVNASLIWGAGNMLLGLIAPSFLTVEDFGVLALMQRSIAEDDSGLLILSSMRLVALNTLRVLPLYTGTLLLAEGLGFYESSRTKYFKFIPLLLIPALYQFIELSYGIAYDLGLPAVSLIIAIALVSQLRDLARSIMHKAIVFSLLLFAMQWLDIVPMLEGYGFGRGEISLEIKRIAVFNNAEDVLNVVGVTMFIVFVANAFIIAQLLRAYTREIETAEKNLQYERLATELKLQSVHNRSLQEKQALVHDLKTPLMTIQGLAGVLSLANSRELVGEYADYISDTVDKMNKMINELLQDDTRQTIEIRELIDYAVAHVPQLSSIAEFQLQIEDGSIPINVNKIKTARAIINILENSLDAVDPHQGRVVITVTTGKSDVKIAINDNGPGISPEHYGRIWEIGFSTKGSSGLGLTFVKDVIQKNGGAIEINSCIGKGASVIITLPRWDYAYEEES